MSETIVDMIPLRIDIHPDEEISGWVAGCPEIDLYSQGPTLEKAWQNLLEALRLWFSYCVEHGTLEQALLECGFSPVRIEGIKETLPGFMHHVQRSSAACRV